jgi:hypothetical protein
VGVARTSHAVATIISEHTSIFRTNWYWYSEASFFSFNIMWAKCSKCQNFRCYSVILSGQKQSRGQEEWGRKLITLRCSSCGWGPPPPSMSKRTLLKRATAYCCSYRRLNSPITSPVLAAGGRKDKNYIRGRETLSVEDMESALFITLPSKCSVMLHPRTDPRCCKSNVVWRHSLSIVMY